MTNHCLTISLEEEQDLTNTVLKHWYQTLFNSINIS